MFGVVRKNNSDLIAAIFAFHIEGKGHSSLSHYGLEFGLISNRIVQITDHIARLPAGLPAITRALDGPCPSY
jgi:hypothetical protein